MIKKTAYIESAGVNPHRNLAVEEYLFSKCGEDEAILYLWQNENTIVIGKNQNAWRECRISRIEEDGAVIARRISGGGAVFHDLGNLNFTFLVSKENYNLKRQLEVILRAVQKLGIHAEASGRNDILVEGQKFSGNAFHEHKGRCYHHGTIMVDVKLGELNKYLNVSKKKLESKGIKSVRSRVTNLISYNPELTINQLKKALRETFEEVYGYPSRIIKEEELDKQAVQELYEKYASWEWVYGKEFEFQYEVSERFEWGQVDIQFQVDSGQIVDAAVYSDSLRPEVIQKLPRELKGIRYNNQGMGDRIGMLHSDVPEEEEMFRNIEAWLRRVDL
ncbi:MAG: lipoate--protein ligase [Dorea sp.]|nr:lipoate--protein ligase [Dorea sp.]